MLIFCIDIICWAPWISWVQSFRLPTMFLRVQPWLVQVFRMTSKIFVHLWMWSGPQDKNLTAMTQKSWLVQDTVIRIKSPPLVEQNQRYLWKKSTKWSSTEPRFSTILIGITHKFNSFLLIFSSSSFRCQDCLFRITPITTVTGMLSNHSQNG